MQQLDSEALLSGIRNDLSLSIDDLFNVIENMKNDIKTLKIKDSKPDKKVANALLGYLSWEDCKVKDTVETLFTNETDFHIKWIENYCKKYNCDAEKTLTMIINDEI